MIRNFKGNPQKFYLRSALFAFSYSRSILAPLLFLLVINDIVKDNGCNILFADKTFLPLKTQTLLFDLDQIKIRAKKWLVHFNPEKPKAFLASRKLTDLFILHSSCNAKLTHIKTLESSSKKTTHGIITLIGLNTSLFM